MMSHVSEKVQKAPAVTQNARRASAPPASATAALRISRPIEQSTALATSDKSDSSLEPTCLIEALSSFDDSRIPSTPAVPPPSMSLVERSQSLSSLPTTSTISPPPRPMTLQRQVSEPARRRSIFGSVYQPPQHSIPNTIEEGTPASAIFHAPPQHRACRADHYLDASSRDLSHYLLPALPSPLQRYYKGKTRTPLQGMYPLKAAKPVLKKTSRLSNTDLADTSLETSSDEGSLNNLIHTLRHHEDDKDERSASSSSSSLQRKVRWDPRVTVTEFEDRVRREWYSDEELEHFKMDAVRVVRAYLLQHPELVPAYNEARLDPVSQTMRKKALYSLPALSGVHEDLEDASEEKLVRLAEQHVKRILVVEPNQVIAGLLRRSLEGIFPFSDITVAHTAAEAISYLQDRHLYDVMLCEQRLEHRQGTELDRRYSESHLMAHYQPKSVYATPSPVHLTQDGVDVTSGSDVLSFAANRAAKRHISQLYIGLTGHPEQCRDLLLRAGADVVWKKPPPPMTTDLRCLLVARLVEKRQQGRNCVVES